MSKTSHRLGKSGEARAVDFLRAKNYDILERNYRFARAEVDIIAQDRDILVFVEVKTAASTMFGNPEAWVTEHKQRQIGLAAQRYLQEHDIQEVDCRFDVIAVRKHGEQWQIKHIENAFWL